MGQDACSGTGRAGGITLARINYIQITRLLFDANSTQGQRSGAERSIVTETGKGLHEDRGWRSRAKKVELSQLITCNWIFGRSTKL